LRQHDIAELTIMGLATDYCVKFTVLDALKLGYRVNVITDGCRGVNINAQDSAHAFMEMAAEGATLYTLADWQETQGKTFAGRRLQPGYWQENVAGILRIIAFSASQLA
jgi:nicotinamidase/pyrazinamidase